MRNSWTKERLEEVVAQIRQRGVKAVARDLGIKPGTLYNNLYNHGVFLRKYGTGKLPGSTAVSHSATGETR